MLHANRISKVNEPLYYYILKREGAITATFSENILQMYDSLAIMNEYYIREGAFEEFKEVLGFINLKHTILRFRDFTAYKDKDLQFKVVRKGFQHLDHYFDLPAVCAHRVAAHRLDQRRAAPFGQSGKNDAQGFDGFLKAQLFE